LPRETLDAATLKRWFRQFVEVRDADGAAPVLLETLLGDDPCTVTRAARGL